MDGSMMKWETAPPNGRLCLQLNAKGSWDLREAAFVGGAIQVGPAVQLHTTDQELVAALTKRLEDVDIPVIPVRRGSGSILNLGLDRVSVTTWSGDAYAHGWVETDATAIDFAALPDSMTLRIGSLSLIINLSFAEVQRCGIHVDSPVWNR